MSNRLSIFIKRTHELLDLLDYFSDKKKVPKKIDAIYSDFYLKNIISNNYTNFENYLRDSLTFIVDYLYSMGEVSSSILSQELCQEIIKKYIKKLPNENNIKKLYKDGTSLIVNKLDIILNHDKFIVDPNDHSFSKLPHEVKEIEKKLCKYLNKEKVLYSITIKKSTQIVSGLEIEEEESAFTFLDDYAKYLRHPVIHQGITLYMNQDINFNINDQFVRMALFNYELIAKELDKFFEEYYEYLKSVQVISSIDNQNVEFDEVGVK